MDNSFTKKYLESEIEILKKLDAEKIDKAISQLKFSKDNGGRVFVLGLGGGAAHALHFTADLRKLAKIDAKSPVENISEFTALVNDEGWNNSFKKYLERNILGKNDTLIIISVGGGDEEKNVSVNIVKAVEFSKLAGCKSISISGREKGFANRNCDISILIDVPDKNMITPHTEGVQSVILHLIASHPELCEVKPKWESLG